MKVIITYGPIQKCMSLALGKGADSKKMTKCEMGEGSEQKSDVTLKSYFNRLKSLNVTILLTF